MQHRSLPIRWLSAGLTLLAATLAGAEEGVLVAQAGGATAEEAPKRTAAAPADSGIEEIVVLGAESESSGDFSAGDSVTGFGAEDLAALGVQDIADLASFTPNLEIVTAGATTPTFFIRGVGLNDFNPNSTGAVAVFQDDVAINAPAIQLGTLFDVEAVNILRGPQGAGMNRNASAGAIKIYSRKPTGDFGGYLRADFGNFDFMDYEGAFEAPIYEDMLSTRVAFRLSQRDGTMLNRCFGATTARVGSKRPNFTEAPWSQCGEFVSIDTISHVPPDLAEYVNNTNNWAGRGTVLFEPTLDMTWIGSAHGTQRDELSRLGQSIGTSGYFCEDPTKICNIPQPADPALFDPSVKTQGLLGGAQASTNANTTPNNGYVPREIRARYNELAPCVVAEDFADQCASQSTAVRLQANEAKIQIANELAQGLDPEPWQGDFDLTGPTTLDHYGGYLTGDVALPGGVHFSSVSSYDTYDRLIDIDLDFSPQTLFHIRTDDDGFQIYQTLEFDGELELGVGNPVRWEAGGYMLRETLNVDVKNDFGNLSALSAVGVSGREYTQSLWSAAGYLSLAFDFLEDYTLDGGFRFNWEQKDLDMIIDGGVATEPEGCRRIPGSPSLRCLRNEIWSAPTGTIRLTYRFREDTQVYAKYTRGWKPGTFNATASQFTGPTTAQPESLDAFEAGLRGAWWEGRIGLGADFFYYSYDDYQIFTARQFLGGTPEFVILNASDAEVYGTEMDATARPWEGAFWNVRFSWLESQFLDFLQTDQFLESGSGQGVPVSFKERQASGNPLLNSPRFKVSLTVEQSIPLGRYGSLVPRYDGVWTDTTYYDATAGRGLGDNDGNKFLPEGTIAQVPFWLHNLQLAWRSPNGGFEVAGWVRNLENKAYKTFAFDGSQFQATTIYFVGDPRTYGVSLRMNF
jgi:outer membrane receptor protein involved in Fe transport